MAATPQLTVVVIDVGASMCANTVTSSGAANGPPRLSQALGSATTFIRNKIVYGKKEQVGIVLFGTEDSDNPFADGEGYEHISIIHDMKPPSLDMLRYLENSVTPGTHPADFMEAVVVGMAMLTEAAKELKKCETHLVLFTDAGSELKDDVDSIDPIVDGLTDLTGVTLVGMFPDDEDDDADEDFFVGLPESQQQGIKLLMSVHKTLSEAADNPLSPMQWVRRFSFRSALKIASAFRKPTVRQTTTCRVCLEVADLKVPLWGYVRQARAKLPSMIKLSGLVTVNPADEESGKVDREVTYHKLDDDETQVDKDFLNKVYKFGSDDIPWAKVDEENMKLESTKMLRLICFVEQNKVPRHFYMGDNLLTFTPPPEDPVAAQAVSSLTQALHNLDYVGIVRYVRAKNAAPKIGMIFPHIRPTYRCLMYVSLPFREDIRHYQFPSLAANDQLKPTPEQDAAMGEFIDKMDLMEGWVDEFGDREEALQPKHTFNPVIQRFWQCVNHRALNPDEHLPEPDPAIVRYLSQSELLIKEAGPAIDKLKAAFTLHKVRHLDAVTWRFRPALRCCLFWIRRVLLFPTHRPWCRKPTRQRKRRQLGCGSRMKPVRRGPLASGLAFQKKTQKGLLWPRC
eukprot:m.11350 g.11350  ORF g.11350 m.11350 type:complete len:625 (-) comp3976_c0_seq2:565-2439(-)